MRLVAAELLRLRSRRATWIILSALVGLCVFFLGGNFVSTSMPTAQDREYAQEFFEESHKEWTENREENYASCASDAALNGGTPEQWGCDDILVEPVLDDYLWAPPGFADRVASDTSGLLVLAAALMFLLGASLTAAEFASGSLGNWLTFAPRRSQVYFSKLAAPAVVALGAALLVTALGVVGTYVWTDLRGIPSAEPLDADALVWTILRSTGVVVVAGALGAALGSLLRHTAAVIGIAAGYFVVVEMVFAGLFWQSNLHRWFLSTQLQAVTQGKASYYEEVCTWSEEQQYRTCESIERFVTAADAALFLGSIGLVLVVVGWLVFRRRDVH